MKKILISIILGITLSTTMVNAEPLTIPQTQDTFAYGNHAFPAKVEIVGDVVTEGSITDSYTYLEGANTFGWLYGMNINSPTIKMIFQQPIEDQPGPDIYIGQGRMAEISPPTGDRHALEFSFDGETWHYLGHEDFSMTSTYWFHTWTNWTWYYQLYKSEVDMSSYDDAPVSITEIYVRGVEYANLIMVGNMNDGEEIDDYKPLVNLFGYPVSYTQNNKVKYNGWYRGTIFAHDASGIRKTILYQKVKGDNTWTKIEEDKNLSNTIGGHFGGYYTVAYDYSAHPVGTVLIFKHVTVDNAGNRTKQIKRARVKANGGLKMLN